MKKLIYILFVLITIAFVVAAIAGFATGRINPEGKEWISFPGLVLLPVLAANLCLFLMWCVFRSHWCWVPLAALLLNWEFLISMFQIRVFPKEIPIGKEAVKVITYNVNNFNTDGKKQLPNIADWLRKELCFRFLSAALIFFMRPAQSGQYFPRLDLGTNAAPQTAHRFRLPRYKRAAASSPSRGRTATRNHRHMREREMLWTHTQGSPSSSSRQFPSS